MADYTYITRVMHDGGTDEVDFETNFKSTALEIGELIFGQASFNLEKTYTEFKVLVDGTEIVWGDVRFVDNYAYYELILINNTPIT